MCEKEVREIGVRKYKSLEREERGEEVVVRGRGTTGSAVGEGRGTYKNKFLWVSYD